MRPWKAANHFSLVDRDDEGDRIVSTIKFVGRVDAGGNEGAVDPALDCEIENQ